MACVAGSSCGLELWFPRILSSRSWPHVSLMCRRPCPPSCLIGCGRPAPCPAVPAWGFICAPLRPVPTYMVPRALCLCHLVTSLSSEEALPQAVALPRLTPSFVHVFGSQEVLSK